MKTQMRYNPSPSPRAKKASDYGLWFLFFCIIYVILLIKTVTFANIQNDLFFGFYSIVIALYILSRFLFAYFHKTVPHDETYQPTVTFVFPAKNEEDNIAETLGRFSAVNYPKDRLEVITINDGSTDGTLQEMQKAKEEAKGIIPITIVDWKVNRGKRHGMAEGVKRAHGEIVLFVDSDSFIEPDCVTHLVKYFSNPEVGAVSGHTDVFNSDTNLLTRMQMLRYYIAFTIYKSAESVFGNVTCCPGCCSAYRRGYLMEFLNEWMNQRFLGTACTFGDDRSLTNFIIKKYRAVYSFEAKAHTIVPDTFRTYFKQQQRWKKSWVRETFIAASFMWKKNTLAAVSFYAYAFLAFSSPIVFFRAVVWHPYVNHELPLLYLFGLLLMLFLHGLYYRIEFGKSSWLLPICTFWFYTVILMWQLPYAVATINDSRWGTR